MAPIDITRSQVLVPGITRNGTRIEPVSLEDFIRRLPALRKTTRHRGTTRGSRWRLILPHETSTGPSRQEIEKALARLCEQRDAEPSLCFGRPDSALGTRLDAATLESWREKNSRELAGSDLLVAGSAADLPFALQQFLFKSQSVGRVSFATADEYAAYADKVVEAESARAELERSFLTFAPNFDAPTDLSDHQVMAPVIQELKRLSPPRQIVELRKGDALRQRLLGELERQTPAPVLFVAAGHGLVEIDPPDPDNGALCDNDARFIVAADIEKLTSALPGGIAVLFACDSAGASAHPLSIPVAGFGIAETTGFDQVSRLAQALLAKPSGPVAVVGHVDIIQELSLRDTEGNPVKEGSSRGLDPFRDLVTLLAQGVPVSEAMEGYRSRANGRQEVVMEAEGRELQRPESLDDDQLVALAHDWLTWNDARSWVVLGDPRARLPKEARARASRMRGHA